MRQLTLHAFSQAPSVLNVFRMYCMEELSVRQIARKCRCSVATVMERLNTIDAKTGVSPRDLRRLSAHFEKIEVDISDPRAKRVYRAGIAHGEPDGV